MKEILAGGSAFLAVVAVAAFVFALVMQPIFVWMICARLKKTNQLLERMASNHKALR